jgi:hypothetical protein
MVARDRWLADYRPGELVKDEKLTYYLRAFEMFAV